MSSASYIERNKGVLTASKLKTFIKSPEAYYLEYIKEVEIDREESTAFLLGTAFDDFLSHGPIDFQEKYFVDEGLRVAELMERCAKIGIETGPKESKDSLFLKVYGDVSEKIHLTKGEMDKVRKMLYEAHRQPLWDLQGSYENQKIIECEYKGMKLRGTLDRFSLDKKMIRDFKTTANLKDFTFKLADKFGYDISMAFYYTLAKVAYDESCDVILDVVQTSGHFQSEVFQYQKERMEQTLQETIIPAMDRLIELTREWEETGDESVWTRDTQGDRYNLFDLDTYSILTTSLQTTISII